MVPTVVDASGVEVFPMSDDAAVKVPLEPPRHRPSRRLVLIPQVGALVSFQDGQSDEFQGHSTHHQSPGDRRRRRSFGRR